MADVLPQPLENYLVRNRDFLAPVVTAAIERLAPDAGARVLDVGTGGGGAIPPLATRVGAHGLVVAADRSPAVLELARSHLVRSQPELVDRVRFHVVDISAEHVSIPDGPFDLIWGSDVLWAENVGDPVAGVARLVEHLAPGGTLALFWSNYYESTFLPGRSAAARAARAASEYRWGLHTSGPCHHDRHLAWLQQNALDDVGLAVLPRYATHIPASDPTALAYLEEVVWPEIIESVTACGTEVGMSPEDIEELQRLLTPGDPSYVLDEPGHYIVHPTLLVTGRRPLPVGQ